MLAELKTVPLFQAVNDEDLRSLAACATRRSLPAGALVFHEGAPADSLFIVTSGSVKIFLRDEAGGEAVLDSKRAGQYFGEMMLDHRPRSASVMTLEPSQFLVVARDEFSKFLRAHPEAAERVIANLIGVARGMNERRREDASIAHRLRQYIQWLETAKASDLPEVKRWLRAKRWVLIGLLAFAIGQYYFINVLLEISSLGDFGVIGRF